MPSELTFSVLPVRGRPSPSASKAYLITDDWDDWGKYSTMYTLIVYDGQGVKRKVGSVKIGQFGMAPKQRRPGLPDKFDTLDQSFFSLGTDESYYETLGECGDALRDQLLFALNDLSMDEDRFKRALRERVTTESLLRSISPVTVRGRFRRLAKGDSEPSKYSFTYTARSSRESTGSALELNFSVIPNQEPPTNLHVLIGRNGVGKTTLLRDLAHAFLEPKGETHGKIAFIEPEGDTESGTFANLVSVTFSAFDPFTDMGGESERPSFLRYLYIGLQRPTKGSDQPQAPKSLGDLTEEFVESVRHVREAKREARWLRALRHLEADPLFVESAITELVDDKDSRSAREAGRRFKRLSSGHKVVLLTITRLVAALEERTLVLIDEPEAHLHPPLLAAFLRALTDLLASRNGVGIVATHSPVVLQEVPRSCVWKLRRSGSVAQAERPEIETFGENVSVLTREAFGLEVTQSGFHKVLLDAVTAGQTFPEVLERFQGQLGAEATAILRGLSLSRDRA